MDLRYNPEKCIRQNLIPKHTLSKRTPQNLTKKAILKNIPHESLPLKHYPEKRSHLTLTPKRISPKCTQ